MKEKIIEHFGGKKPKTTLGAQTLSLMQDRLFLTTNCPSIDGTNPVQIPPFACEKILFFPSQHAVCSGHRKHHEHWGLQ